MDLGFPSVFFKLVALSLFGSLVALAERANADLISADNFTIGAGGYTAGTVAAPVPLHNQTSTLPSSIGFLAGSTFNGGSGTSNFDVYQGGQAVDDPATAGTVSYYGVGSDNLVRSNARALISSLQIPTLSTYWFSINVSQDGSSTTSLFGTATNGYALAGFGNNVPPLLGTTAGNVQGLFFGFTHEVGDPAGANADLAIRYRNGSGTTVDSVLIPNAAVSTTYKIIASLTVNAGGPGNANDYLSYWVDPTNTSSVAALDASSLVYSDYLNGGGVTTLAFQTTADLMRLNFSAQNWNGDTNSANFGDPTMAGSLSDLSPYLAPPPSIPEPTSIVMLAIGLAGVLVAANRRAFAWF